MYHEPVMVEECMEGLKIDPEGVYVDATYGGGGHAKRILSFLKGGRLIAFDQDEDAGAQVIRNDRLVFVPANFRYLRQWMNYLGLESVDGVLADLGVSSHQLDVPERGFSFRWEEALDLRMNTRSEVDVWQLLNELEAQELQELFSKYGEIRNARTLAMEIIREREKGRISTASRLIGILEKVKRGDRNRYFAQAYQALRIYLNDEMAALEEFLDSLHEVVKPGGRLVVMSYHSLEDRRVKNLIKKGNSSGDVIKDEFGNFEKPWKEVVKGLMKASEKEIEQNSRARSAKLRIAERKE